MLIQSNAGSSRGHINLVVSWCDTSCTKYTKVTKNNDMKLNGTLCRQIIKQNAHTTGLPQW